MLAEAPARRKPNRLTIEILSEEEEADGETNFAADDFYHEQVKGIVHDNESKLQELQQEQQVSQTVVEWCRRKLSGSLRM